MTRSSIALSAGLGSLALLLGAFAFQHIAGLAPCPLCLWQRYPHAVAAVFGLAALALPMTILCWAGAAAALSSAGIGLYHVGVEQRWWTGPGTCSTGDVSGMSAEDLMAQIMAAPLVRCDEIAWAFAGISMAGWNAILSIGLAALWFAALRHKA